MGMGNLQTVYEANAKRLQETRAAQKTAPKYIEEYKKSITPRNNISFATPMTSSERPLGTVNDIQRLEDNRNQQLSGAPVGYTLRNGRIYDATGKPASPSAGDGAAPGGKTAALAFWEDQNQAWNKANEDTLVDRGAMLGELADFKAQSVMNNQNIERELSDLGETLRVSSEETLSKVRNSFAAMGRSVSPYVMAGISSRLALQSKDKLNLRRSQLEMDRAQIHGAYLEKLNGVLADTKRTTMDPSAVLAMMKELSGGDAGGGLGGTGGAPVTRGGKKRSTGGRMGGAGGRIPAARTGRIDNSEFKRQFADKFEPAGQQWAGPDSNYENIA